MKKKVRISVLVSGGGSNLKSLIDMYKDSETCEIVQVISSKAGVYALERGKAHGIPGFIADRETYPDMRMRMAKILELMERKDTDLVVLAGYLDILSKEVVDRYRNRIINIHPSLLPKFGGKDCYGMKVHEKVLQAGEKVSGATVHLVDEGIDTGEIILQKKVEVLEDDTPEKLAERVLKVEHEILPKAVEMIVNSQFKNAE